MARLIISVEDVMMDTLCGRCASSLARLILSVGDVICSLARLILSVEDVICSLARLILSVGDVTAHWLG